MRRLVASLLLSLLFLPTAAPLQAQSDGEPIDSCGYTNELAKIIESIASSDMPAEAKERSIIVVKEAVVTLQKDKLELESEKDKAKRSFWSSFLDVSWKVVTLGASVFAGIKAAQ